MFNCQSNEERYQWMHKIASAVPGIPDAQKAAREEQPKHEEERAEVKEGAAADKAKEMTEEAKEKALVTEEPKKKAVVAEEPKEEVGKAQQETVQSDVASSEDAIDGRYYWHHLPMHGIT